MVKKHKLKWFGHVSRSAGLAKKIVQGTVPRRRGRRKKRWENNTSEWTTGKHNRFQLLDILGYTHKNPKFGKVRQVPTREFPTNFPGWDMSHSSKYVIFVGIL